MWNYILSSILILLLTIFYQCYFPNAKSVIDYPESRYDYIIGEFESELLTMKFWRVEIEVGAGTAGCVVSSRLSENPNSTILLIEAGSYFNYWLSSIPLLASFMQLSKVDWAYQTESQSFSSKGFYDRVFWISFYIVQVRNGQKRIKWWIKYY